VKILFLGNNWLGWQVLKWLVGTGRKVIGVVIHPEEKQKYADKILEAAALPAECAFSAPLLKDERVLEKIKSLEPEVGLSVMFDYVLEKEFLEIFSRGCYNLHPSYLPYNRGNYSNVWSIIGRTPAGVTLHMIDGGVDTGAIIAQREVEIEPVDTGETLYRKLENTGVQLFEETWPLIESGEVTPVPQDKDVGEFLRKRDVEKIDCIDLDKDYKARDLIDILRARTFPPYKGAYFVENGKKIFMELKLYYGEKE